MKPHPAYPINKKDTEEMKAIKKKIKKTLMGAVIFLSRRVLLFDQIFTKIFWVFDKIS